MSEIEKMYENAGIEYEERYNNCTLNKEGDCELKCSCDICKYSEEKYIYPLFTAEKQLELIKWLARKSHITIGLGLPWGQYDDSWWTVTSKNGGLGTNAYKLEEALANLVNNLWQDLTEEEKQQVKGILE